MGSNYFGEPNLGSERSGGRKGKKSSNSDKPKQPQRGLGVAQLEKIRLQTQLGWSHPPYSNLNQQVNYFISLQFLFLIYIYRGANSTQKICLLD